MSGITASCDVAVCAATTCAAVDAVDVSGGVAVGEGDTVADGDGDTVGLGFTHREGLLLFAFNPAFSSDDSDANDEKLSSEFCAW